MLNRLKREYNKLKLNKNLYIAISSDKFATEDDFLNTVATILDNGAGIIQYGETNKPASKITELGNKIKLLCAEYDATFIIRERVDIAFILDADGVHLNPKDIDICSARRILGENAIIGYTPKNAEDAKNAILKGTDYLIYENPQKDFPIFQPIQNTNTLSKMEKYYVDSLLNSQNPTATLKEILKKLQ